MFYRTYHRIAAVAVLGAVALTGTAQLASAQAAAAPEKKVKDQGEYDIYNQTLKDLNNPAALLKDLDTWAQKYPDSDWKDDRLYYYIRPTPAPTSRRRCWKSAIALMQRDLKKVYTDPKAGPQMILTVLYQMAVNLTKIPNPTPEQMQTARARRSSCRSSYRRSSPRRISRRRPPTPQWNEGKTTMEKVAKDTQMYVATKPGADA